METLRNPSGSNRQRETLPPSPPPQRDARDATDAGDAGDAALPTPTPTPTLASRFFFPFWFPAYHHRYALEMLERMPGMPGMLALPFSSDFGFPSTNTGFLQRYRDAREDVKDARDAKDAATLTLPSSYAHKL